MDADGGNSYREEFSHVQALLPGRSPEAIRWALQQVNGNLELAIGLLLDAEGDADDNAVAVLNAGPDAEVDSAPRGRSSACSAEEGDEPAEITDEQSMLMASTGPPSPAGSSGPSEWSFHEEGFCESPEPAEPDVITQGRCARDLGLPEELNYSPGASSSSSSRLGARRWSSAAGGADIAAAMPDAAPWEVLNPEGLEYARSAELERVQEVLGVSLQAARVLLAHFGFDYNRLLESYADDPDRTLLRAGLPAADTSGALCQAGAMQHTQASCSSCLEDLSADELVDLTGCGHVFCRTCWRSFLLIKVREGESCRLRCMSFKCGKICNDALVLELLTGADPDAAACFTRSLREAYVSENRTGLVKWCPSAPHCGNAVRLVRETSVGKNCEVVCRCGHRFCFSCLEQAHTPCSCEMLKSWGQKEAGESATSKWLLANSKACPRCKNPVEKNGGCNHVMCRCGQSFCWHCGQATGTAHTWNSIVDHTCGRFKEDALQQAKQAEKDLSRYLHYYDRWRSHMNSLKFEAQQEANVSEKIECLLCKLPSYLESYLWLRDGAAQLSVCRRVLAYSYVFAYYAFGSTSIFADEVSAHDDQVNRNLFEMKQEELEQAVENLSKFIETPLEDMLKDGAISKIKQAVLDLTVNVDSRSLRLCQTVQNDILDRMATSHGIAAYKARTQVVLRDQREQPVTAAVAFAGSSSSGSRSFAAMGSCDAQGESADMGQRPRKRLRASKPSARKGPFI